MHTLNKFSTSIIPILIALMLTGCYTDFEPNIKSTPVVCLNSRITAGEIIKAEVTRTWRYSEGNPVDRDFDIFLKEAEVELYVNDRYKENLTLTSETNMFNETDYYFISKFVPTVGDVIRLHVLDKEFGEAEAEVKVPYPVDIDDVDVRITRNNSFYDEENEFYESHFDLVVNVGFKDPANDVNFYVFNLYSHNVGGYFDEDNIYHNPLPEVLLLHPDYSHEPLFSEHITPIETVISDGYGIYTVFSDRQISGKQYNLVVPASGSYDWNNFEHTDLGHRCELCVQLAHISPSYYNYMLSLWAATEGVSGALGDVGLGDAVFEFSNVSTGAGIVTARALSTVKLNFYDLLIQSGKE